MLPARSGGKYHPPAVSLVVSLLLAVSLTVAFSGPAAAQRAAAIDRDAAVREVVALDQEAEELNARIAELEHQSEEIEARISQLEGEAAGARERLGDRKRALARRVRSNYIRGKTSRVEMILSSRDFSDFLHRNEYFKKVATDDARLISNIRSESKRIEVALNELEKKHEDLEANRQEADARRGRIASARAAKQELLARPGVDAEQVRADARKVESKIDEVNAPSPPPAPEGRHTGRFLVMEATGYSPEEPGLDENTASGMKATRGVVAVDPRVIPLGTRLYVEGYGNAIAGDTGSAIKGNRIDLCFDTLEEVEAYGWRTVTVEILD